MVGETAVEFHFLRFGQRRRDTSTNDTVPDGFNQFDLLVNAEHTSLL